MRNRFCLFLLLTLIGGSVTAQTVQWASKLVAFSSEYGSDQYSAKQVLGSPNVLPAFKESPCAWSPKLRSNRGDEYLHVAFAQPMAISQVAIAESFGAGAIVEVWLYDINGKAYKVYTNKTPAPLEEIGRMLLITVPLTTYKVKEVKVVLNTISMQGWSHIDAIGISDGVEPITAKINLLEGTLIATEPTNLGPSINSKGDEIMPVIAGNGKVLYIDRKDHLENTGGLVNDDIWRAELGPDGEWEEIQNVGTPLNTKGHNFLCGTTYDGKTALLGNIYESDGYMTAGVSLSHLTAKGWTFPKKIEIADYYNNNKFSEFGISADARVLVMTIQRTGTFGGKDIYVSFGDSLSGYSEPLNLGATVNTAATEMSPFLAADGKTLYFASDGRSGYGNKDIFMTRRLDDTWLNWTEPANLGPLVNSSNWDAYFSVPADGEFAYLCSEKNAIGKTDIYRVPLPAALQPRPVVQLIGHAVRAENQLPTTATLKIMRVGADPVEGNRGLELLVEGEFRVFLEPGFEYVVSLTHPKLVAWSSKLDLRSVQQGATIEQTFPLEGP